MGCGGSKPAQEPKGGAPPVQATPLPEEQQPKPKAKAKAKARAGPVDMKKKFQIKLQGDWSDYEAKEDTILKKAYLVGHPNCKFHLRGQNYEYNFKSMKQINLGTHKEREIRPPPRFKPPAQALLPPGPMTVLTVRPGQAGTTVDIPDPNNKGQTIKVNVPAGAKEGQKMAVPLPEKGEKIEATVKKQAGYSTGAKLAMGTAGVGLAAGVALGGVILGDHLTGGTLGVSEAAADIAGDAGEVIADTAEDAAEWVEGAAEDAGEWIEGAAEDAGDWLGDAAEDTGDFIMSLF